MITRVGIAAVVGAIVMFILGFLIYGILLDSYMKSAMSPDAAKLMKEMPNLLLLFVGNLATSWMLTYIFERWAGIKNFASGLVAGILIALPMMIGFDLMMFATTNMMTSFMPMIVDVLAFTVMAAITGGVIGQVLGMLNKNQTAE